MVNGNASNEPVQIGDTYEGKGNCAGFPPANVHVDDDDLQTAQQRLKRAGQEVANRSPVNLAGRQSPNEDRLPPGYCERPPFVVRHVRWVFLSLIIKNP